MYQGGPSSAADGDRRIGRLAAIAELPRRLARALQPDVENSESHHHHREYDCRDAHDDHQHNHPALFVCWSVWVSCMVIAPLGVVWLHREEQ
eukprot:CAMPEP_0206548092 /NCGR_PEP_ID=MMETSP0325_2-20121206/13681_1 /ASSEMBLY_ACC=CAM_ASM_000347 /TAXON_ID=2866 /ORGANISM="Crypthecodinium cohnii, Strain Seligo" /LENGTH=91 /DNA_ID=CAMNT_0054047513 /DNA_START=108 /DNA_END=383 /DNA_ORIENTATION=+